jgi:hypothetical protein
VPCFGQRLDRDLGDVFCIDEGFCDMTDGEGPFPLKDRFQELCLAEILEEPAGPQDCPVVLASPALRDIWSGMQADKQLMALELQESRIAGGLLAGAMLRVYPDSDALPVQEAAFLIWRLGEATMRLDITCAPEEGRGLVEVFKRLSLREIMASVAGSSEFDPAAESVS